MNLEVHINFWIIAEIPTKFSSLRLPLEGRLFGAGLDGNRDIEISLYPKILYISGRKIKPILLAAEYSVSWFENHCIYDQYSYSLSFSKNIF